MFSFIGAWASHNNMHDWHQQRPEFGTEVILVAACKILEIKSWKSIEAFRGFYTTWTEGSQISGTPLGLQSSQLPIEARTAFLTAQAAHRMPAFLVNPMIEFTGQTRPGVIDADVLNGAWWIGVDELAKEPVPPDSMFDLERPKTRAAIKFKNKTYPIDPIPQVSIVRSVKA